MQKQKVFTILYTIILMLGISLAIFSSYHFITGFHNIDMGYNLNIINMDYGLELVDRNSAGEIWSGYEMYKYGQGQMREAFALLGISVFLIGFSLKGVLKL